MASARVISAFREFGGQVPRKITINFSAQEIRDLEDVWDCLEDFAIDEDFNDLEDCLDDI